MKYWLFFYIGLFLFLFYSISAAELGERDLSDAFADIKYERYLDALEKLDNIIKERERIKDHMYYEALFGKAKVYFHIRDYERCRIACDEILSVDISELLKSHVRDLRLFCLRPHN